jgi:YVTN family beta-propeller protein
VTATVTVGSEPDVLAVNPITNQIYVANSGGNTVTVIDGASNTPASVTVGTTPAGVAVNPLTNQIYVANSGGNTVTVIDTDGTPGSADGADHGQPGGAGRGSVDGDVAQRQYWNALHHHESVPDANHDGDQRVRHFQRVYQRHADAVASESTSLRFVLPG